MVHHPHASVGAIAIVGTDTLRNVGLKALLERLLPMTRIETYYAVDELQEQGPRRFMHYFVAPNILATAPAFFAERRMQTIVVGETAPHMPQAEGFHHLATDGAIDQIVGNLLLLLQRGHAHFAHFPEAMTRMMQGKVQNGAPLFTPREAEVLALVTKGHSTKEIADHLHVSQQTVMTHRKNIMEKVGVHSATQLVVWALTQDGNYH